MYSVSTEISMLPELSKVRSWSLRVRDVLFIQNRFPFWSYLTTISTLSKTRDINISQRIYNNKFVIICWVTGLCPFSNFRIYHTWSGGCSSYKYISLNHPIWCHDPIIIILPGFYNLGPTSCLPVFVVFELSYIYIRN